jgi:tRNA-dihydrouridine synthase C
MSPTPSPIPRLILAPMEGVLDAIMRDQLTAIGGYERCVTEFVRVSQTLLPRRVFHRYAPELKHGGVTPSGVPVFVQLLGSDPALMAANAARAATLGAPGIDLNFGCPAKTVNRSQGGAALLRTPLLIRSICQAVREHVPNTVPVTAKIRLGYDTEDQFEEILDALAQVELSELTIHARTRRQGYRPPAHWHQLSKATQKMPYPVIANGELWSPSDVTRCAAISGCDTFMLARGALCRPDLAAAIQGHYRGIEPPVFAWPQTQELLIQFLERNQQTYDERYAVNPVKQWLMYLRTYYPQAGALFNEVKRINDPTQMAQALMAPSRSEAA